MTNSPQCQPEKKGSAVLFKCMMIAASQTIRLVRCCKEKEYDLPHPCILVAAT